MTTTEIVTAVVIHIIVPIIGLLYYIRLIIRMEKENVENPPNFGLFMVFATYGGLLIVVLTTLFWEWSAMASLGAFYLILGAPIVMGLIAYTNYQNRHLSKYHDGTYISGLLYFFIAPLTLLMLSFFDTIMSRIS